nr:hypothetical protein [uncultured Glaciecola sp.]
MTEFRGIRLGSPIQKISWALATLREKKGAMNIPLVVLVSCSIIAGCSSLNTSQQNNDRLRDLVYGSNDQPQIDPLDGDAHLNNGLALLARSNKSPGELYFARSAFERAAVLKIDDPRPHFLSGYSNYLLGDYGAAYQSFVSAAVLDKSADGWWLASLSALQGRNELLAQALYNMGLKVSHSSSELLGTFMDRIYGGSQGLENRVDRVAEVSYDNFNCTTPADDPLHGEISCEGDAKVEFFIVQRSSAAGASIGQDLVSKLSVGLGGSLLSFDRSYFKDDSGSSTETTKNRNVSVDLPSINYALSLAADNGSVSYVNSMPILSARLGVESKIFSGQSIQVLATGDGSSVINEDVGTTVSFNLVGFTESEAIFDANVEMSDFSAPTFTGNFAQLGTNTTSVFASASVPYNRAFLLGSLEYTSRTDINSGQTGIRDIPFVGNLFSNHRSDLSRMETAVLAIIRPPSKIGYDQESVDLKAMKKLGVITPIKASRRPIAHLAPTMGMVLSEIGILSKAEPALYK